MLTEVEEREPVLLGAERSGRRRHDHLAAVAGGGDASSPVNVGSDVSLVGHKGRAGVQADPDLDPSGAQLLDDRS